MRDRIKEFLKEYIIPTELDKVTNHLNGLFKLELDKVKAEQSKSSSEPEEDAPKKETFKDKKKKRKKQKAIVAYSDGHNTDAREVSATPRGSIPNIDHDDIVVASPTDED